MKREKGKGSQRFPFPFYICRQCRQNKGFSAPRAIISKGVANAFKTEKWGHRAEKVSVYKRNCRGHEIAGSLFAPTRLLFAPKDLIQSQKMGMIKNRINIQKECVRMCKECQKSS